MRRWDAGHRRPPRRRCGSCRSRCRVACHEPAKPDRAAPLRDRRRDHATEATWPPDCIVERNDLVTRISDPTPASPGAHRSRFGFAGPRRPGTRSPQRTRIMSETGKVLYTAKAHTTGGREGGASRTDDGHLEVKISPPGSGSGTNPEQLFAAGWSTCFLSAIKLVAGKRKIRLTDGVAVDAEVDLNLDG